MEQKSRTYNSVANSVFGLIAALINVALNFVVRICIVKFLGDEINGLHNLFQNTINVMALMETGISSAMVIHLYKPVKEEDEKTIRELLGFYKKIYLLISFAFLILGLIVGLFVIDKIVTTTITAWRVKLYFLLFAASFFVNYLTYFKRSILFAEQKNRISIFATTISEVLFRGLAILLACLTGNYILFLLCIIVEKLFSNLICILYVDKHHKYLRHIQYCSLSRDKKKEVIGTIKPLIVNQTASTVQKSANSILISILLGNVAIVGYFGNYQLVRSTVELLFSQFGGAFTSGFGNLSVSGDKERMYYIYKRMRYLVTCATCVVISGFLVCIQDFIELCFTKTYVLEIKVVIVLAFALIIYLLSIPSISVQNALGLHRKDEVLMVIQTITAIVTAYFLGLNFGMIGIILGLNAPTFIFTTMAKGVIINKYAFEKKGLEHILLTLSELLCCVVIPAICVLICCFFSFKSLFLNIIVKAIVAVIISVGFIILFSIKNPYFKEIIQILKRRKNYVNHTKD